MPITPSLTDLPTELRFAILGHVLDDLDDRISVACCGNHGKIERTQRRAINKLKPTTALFKVNRSLRADTEAFLSSRIELSFCTKHASDTVMWPERCQGPVHEHSRPAITKPDVTSCGMSSYARWVSNVNIRVDIGGTVFDYEIEELYRRALVDDMRSIVLRVNEQPEAKKLTVQVFMRGAGKHWVFDEERLAEHLSIYEQLDDSVDLTVSVFARCKPRHKLTFEPYSTETINAEYLKKLQDSERSKGFDRVAWLLHEWLMLRSWVDAQFDFDNQLGRVWLRYSRPSRQVDEDVKPRLIGLLTEAWAAHHHGKPSEFGVVKTRIEKLLQEHRSNRLGDVEKKLSVWATE